MWSHVRAGPAEPSSLLPRDVPPAAEKAWNDYFRSHASMARFDRAGCRLAEVIGPMFWAALILLFLWAELTPNG